MPATEFIHIPDEFLRLIPKTDLHVHLDGSLRISTLIELSQEQGLELPADTVQGMREKVFKDEYADLNEYLAGFRYTTAIMQTAPALERIAYEFAVDNYAEGVRYFEVRFAPQLHANILYDGDSTTTGLTMEAVLEAVNNGLKRATDEYNAKPEVENGFCPPHRYGIIVCALRMFMSEFSAYYKQFIAVHEHEEPRRLYGLASMALVTAAVAIKKQRNLPIVALDVAGAEHGYPAKVHEEAFRYAHKNHLNKTVHAGEAFGPESIWQALTDLHANRIGHGYHIFSADRVQDPKLLSEGPEKVQQWVDNMAEYIAIHRLTLEVCLTSNLQTMPELQQKGESESAGAGAGAGALAGAGAGAVEEKATAEVGGRASEANGRTGGLKNHKFGEMLAKRLSVTLNTDNRLVGNTTTVKELRLAVDTFKMSPRQLKEVVINGFKRSFCPLPYVQKRIYVRKVLAYYEELERKFGLDGVSVPSLHLD